MPKVKIMYAVKVNPDEKIIRKLIELDCGFDCSSLNEIKKVIKLGGDSEKIIFSHPIKQDSHIIYAKKVGVKLLVVDCVEEVETIAEIYPEAELCVRLFVTKTDSLYPINKFGASKDQWIAILNKCKELKMKVRGASFHVGSGGTCFESYQSSLNDTKLFF